MKVIVNTETVPGSGTSTYVYMPEGKVESATDEALVNTMRKLWENDCNSFKDEIDKEQTYFNEDEAVIYARSRSITYEILKVNEVAA